MNRQQNALRRAAAAEAVRRRFGGKPYEPGKRDCARMALHLLHGLGVRLPIRVDRAWSSERSGIRALKAAGFDSLPDAVTGAGFPEIAPAMAVVGDLVALPTQDALGALGVVMGNGKVLAFHEGSPNCEVIAGAAPLKAWRTLDG